MSTKSAPRSIPILVVEDHDLTATLVVQMLHGGGVGWTCHRAATAGLGFTEFLRLRPALIVLDVGLPDGSGIEVTQRIRAVDAATPIVIHTVHDSDVLREAARAAGAHEFVCKDNPRELLAVVQRLLGAARGENSPQESPERPTDTRPRTT